MNQIPNRNTRSSAFSLIEMLVVIAIIGLLFSMLMPAVSTALSKAKGGQCKANLGQLVKGMYAYGQDNNDTWSKVKEPYVRPNGNDANRLWSREFLFDYLFPGREWTDRTGWPSQVKGFGHVFGTPFVCPSAKYGHRPNQGQNGQHYSFSYNGRLAEPQKASTDETFIDEWGKPMNRVESPIFAMAFIDGFAAGTGPVRYTNQYPVFERRHNRRVNIAFVDSHVESRDGREVPQTHKFNSVDGDDESTLFWRGYTRY